MTIENLKERLANDYDVFVRQIEDAPHGNDYSVVLFKKNSVGVAFTFAVDEAVELVYSFKAIDASVYDTQKLVNKLITWLENDN